MKGKKGGGGVKNDVEVLRGWKGHVRRGGTNEMEEKWGWE